jgi:hypothetical protein
MTRRFANPRSQPIGLTTHDAKDPDPKSVPSLADRFGVRAPLWIIGGENNQ